MAGCFSRNPRADENVSPRIPHFIDRAMPRSLFAAVAACLVLTSCALLPPGLRGDEKEKKARAAGTPPAGESDFGPAKPVASPPVTPGAEARTFTGTGIFLNPKPAGPPPAPGPGEASLNL